MVLDLFRDGDSFNMFHACNRRPTPTRAVGEPPCAEPRFEPLEVRQLLDVTGEDLTLIRQLYPGLNLAADIDAYHVIEITAAELSDTALRDALADTLLSDDNSLIVIRTTTTQNKIVLSAGALILDIDASEFGSVTIVSLGDKPLTIDANRESRVMVVGETAKVALAGLTLTGGAVINGQDPDGSGGGIWTMGILTVLHSTITGNTADGGGGGIYANGPDGRTTVTNSVIAGNTAGAGGGLYATGLTTVTNCTIVANTGGGVFHDGTDSTTILTNNILVENSAYDVGSFQDGVAERTLTDVLGGYYNLTTRTSWNEGSATNIVYDSTRPLFVDVANGDYRPLPGSQAVNAGSNLLAANAGLDGTSKDLSGKARIFGGTVDLGAHESYLSANSVTFGQTHTGTLAVSNEFSAYWTFSLNARSLVSFDLLLGVMTGLTVKLIGPDGGIQTLTTASAKLWLADAGTYYVSFSSAAARSYTFRMTAKAAVDNLTSDASVKAPKASLDKSSLGAQSLTLQWKAVAGADGYWIEWYVKKALVGSLWVSGGNVTSAALAGLEPGTSYTFRVYTTTANDTVSAKYAKVSAKTRTIPKLKSVKAKANGGSAIIISWKTPKASTIARDMRIIGYNIYDKDGNLVATAGPDTTSYRITSLTPKTTYRYTVVAVCEPKLGGAVAESYKVAKVKARTKKPSIAAPKLGKVMIDQGDVGLTSLTVRWTLPATANAFIITCSQKKTDIPLDFGRGGNARFLYDDNDQVIGATIMGLSPGVKYTIAIRSMNSVEGTVSKATKKSLVTAKFPATKTPRKVQITSTQAVITWAQSELPRGVSGTVSYEVYYTEQKGLKPGAETGWTLIPPTPDEGEAPGVTVKLLGNVASIAGLPSGRTCYVYIRTLWSEDTRVFSNSKAIPLKTV